MDERCTTRGRVRSGAFLVALPFLTPPIFLTPSLGEQPRGEEVARSAPILAPELVPVAARLEAESAAERDAALALLDSYRPLLRFLPIDELSGVHVRRDALEFEFDFGPGSTRRVELPAVRRWVLDPATAAGEHPLAGCRAEEVETTARTLIVHRRLHLKRDGQVLRGVADGDLEIAYGMFAPNLSLATEHRPGDFARDPEGRILLEVNELGLPVRENGRWVPVRSDRWLILEVKGRRIELPLDPRRFADPARGFVTPHG